MAESAKFAATTFDAPRTKDRMGSKQMLTSHAMLKKPNRDHTLEPILKPPDLTMISKQANTPFPVKHDPESAFRYIYSLSHTPANY